MPCSPLLEIQVVIVISIPAIISILVFIFLILSPAKPTLPHYFQTYLSRLYLLILLSHLTNSDTIRTATLDYYINISAKPKSLT
jgi:hypothetical protein